MAHNHPAAVTVATDRAPLLVARNLLPSDASVSNSSIKAEASTTSVKSSSLSSSVAAIDAQSRRQRDRKCTGDSTVTSTSSSTTSLSLDISSAAVPNTFRRARHHTSHNQPVNDSKNDRRSPSYQASHSRHRRQPSRDAHAGDGQVSSDSGLNLLVSPLPASEHDSCSSSGGQASDKEENTVTEQQRQEPVTIKPSRMVVKRRATAPASSSAARRTSVGLATIPLSPNQQFCRSVDKASATSSPRWKSSSPLTHGLSASIQRSTSTLEKWQHRLQRSISGGTDDERARREPSSSRRLYSNCCSHQLLESPPPPDEIVATRRTRGNDKTSIKVKIRTRSSSRGSKQPVSPRTIGGLPPPSPPPPLSLSSDEQMGPTTPRALARKIPHRDKNSSDEKISKPRPVRIRYESSARGMGGKREISHASLGKLIAHLTDAHQFDTEFRDVFLLTYRSFCSPYDFIKKLLKRYTAVLSLCGNIDAERLEEIQRLLDQITLEEENEQRSSNVTSVSTAKSDINTGMEANVSIMRLLSVLKFWIKESTFIEQDLANDRKAQKKLIALLKEIEKSSPIPSVRRHAETLLLTVAQVLSTLKQQAQQAQITQAHTQAQAKAQSQRGPAKVSTPLMLVTSSSVSSIPDRAGSRPAVDDPLSAAASVIERHNDHGEVSSRICTKLALPRSSSDPKRERSMVKLRSKNPHVDIIQIRSRSVPNGIDDSAVAAAASRDRAVRSGAVPIAAAVAPKIARGITTGSAEAVNRATGNTEAVNKTNGSSETMNRANGSGNIANGFDELIKDTLQRARLTATSRKSARISYGNVEPLTGLTAQELADQLTLIEAEQYFAKLNPRELTNKAWTRENKHRDAPHVMALIELFDAIAEWVSSEILHPQLQAVERAKMITLFIDTADHCYQMNNFNSLFEISTGLSAPCIRQLNTTWSLVSAAASEKYQCLQQLCSPDENYRSYRQAFGLAEGQPRLACWFILVKDLFTYEEAMKSVEDGLVNWHKFRKIYRVISDAIDVQNFNYVPPNTGANGSGNGMSGVSRKGRGILRHDKKNQIHIRHRIDTIRKDSSVLYQLARNANTQESILFVNSLSEAGFL
ncbi:ras guanine nucleotide exchange factor [Plasmopara halstedii]|uniref:Ras guanine nucleotide exchange factor n=1 Tax=Plasmopara halstedii TaxID=4781 RepID=A0A0P1AXQ0_PLAHL|nr:ras guanine nucleotide exchange factor [Plasmopara halstedii]CEG46223.1 ras guanine nucleotide exchange factor [Plasmopara halstedii]|eukprot:XP_024582592.1 ras guanine nucleotide exchange factor [Plasmopara halstedii]